MKTFVLTVECKTAAELVEALDFAKDCVQEDLDGWDDIGTDIADEQLCDPNHITSTLTRTE